MKIAYNPSNKILTLDQIKVFKNDIIFDVNSKNIYAKGVQFKGTDTTYSVFKKHTTDALTQTLGYDGLVPAPSYSSTTTRFLREDGLWHIPLDTKVSQSLTTFNTYRPIVLGATLGSDPKIFKNITSDVYTSTSIYVNPALGSLHAKTFIGNLKGIADEAKKVHWDNITNIPLLKFLLKEEYLSYKLTTINRNIQLTTNWLNIDLVLNNFNFPDGSGSYLVLLSMGDGYLWTGYCSLNINALIETEYTDEIILLGSGLEDAQPYLRVVQDPKHNIALILIAYSKDRPKIETWTLKFKRII